VRQLWPFVPQASPVFARAWQVEVALLQLA
jgi:hypothetical protein